MPKVKKAKNNTKFWQFRAKADTPAEGELLLYGEISSHSWWGDEVTPKQFKEDLDALGDIEILNVYINSGGGDVFAGQAIHSMLKRHKAQVKVYVDGLAASIASVIAMAGDVVYMPRNAMMMIHKAWTWGVGNADDFRKLADDLDKIGESIVNTYEDKTGMDRDEIVKLMSAETWMTVEEAVEYGFADEIEGTKEVAASMNKGNLTINGQVFDFSRYDNPPKMVASVPIKRSKAVRNEGRTISAANEQRLTQARDLLGEVLDQLDDSGSSNQVTPGARLLNMPMLEEGDCSCESCSHGDNCQTAGAKCCICGNCSMATKCSKPGAEGCNCKDCTMAQTNCCQPGSESCMCDTCTNMDCKKGNMEDPGQPTASVKSKPAPEGAQQALVDLYAKLNLNNRRRANV